MVHTTGTGFTLSLDGAELPCLAEACQNTAEAFKELNEAAQELTGTFTIDCNLDNFTVPFYDERDLIISWSTRQQKRAKRQLRRDKKRANGTRRKKSLRYQGGLLKPIKGLMTGMEVNGDEAAITCKATK